MSGSEHDPLNFREVDPQGNATGYGRVPPAGGFAQKKGFGRDFGQPGFEQPAAAGQPSSVPYGEADSGQPGRLAVNPFIVALWALVAVLLLSPFGVFTLAQESLNSGAEQQVMPMGYMWITFAPQIIFAGLVGLLGLLFWHAAQWQRNRGKQPPPS